MSAVLLTLGLALAIAEPTPTPSPSPAPSALKGSPEHTAPGAAPATAPAASTTTPTSQPKPAPIKPAPKLSPKPIAPTPVPVEPGRVSEGMIRFGQDVELASGQAVDGPVIAIGGSVTVDGPVEGPVIALGGFAKLGPRAVVNGPVISFGGGSQIDPAAKLDDPVLGLPGARGAAKVLAPLATLVASLAALAVFGKLLAGLGWLVVGLVLWTLFPDALRNTRDTLERQTAACIVWGLFAAPCLAAVTVAFAVSLVGLPLVPVIGMLGAAGYVWGTVALGYWLGSRAGEGKWDSAVVSILVGLLALKVLSFVPIVRWVAQLAILILALGAAFASRFGWRGPGLVTPVVPK